MCVAEPRAGPDLREDRRQRITVMPWDMGDLAHRERNIRERSVGDGENVHLTFPTKGKELGVYSEG